MWRFLRNRRLLLCLHTIFRALIYWAHRAVVLAIAWHLVLSVFYCVSVFFYLIFITVLYLYCLKRIVLYFTVSAAPSVRIKILIKATDSNSSRCFFHKQVEITTTRYTQIILNLNLENIIQSRLNTLGGPGAAALTRPPLETPKSSKEDGNGEGIPPRLIRRSGKAS